MNKRITKPAAFHECGVSDVVCGVKDTGNGHRECGWTAYDIFSEPKTVYIDCFGELQKA